MQRLPLEGLQGNSPPRVAHPAAALPVPYVLSCGLEEGLIPALESSVRSCMQQVADGATYARLVDMLDLITLRRPGCWPAVLAYGDDPRQAAALIITLGKAPRRLVDPSELPPGSLELVTLAATVLNVQLLALLEQFMPRCPCRQQRSRGRPGGARRLPWARPTPPAASGRPCPGAGCWVWV